ncbi:hypothetical protein Gohar_027267 [Gossypium harknessii]|uniref:Uncharacterized protein n=1 Tax=Gossypium harknessii TaxID=34285 RepID=A0A7J9HU66_9ROSI|nr:hypothetical protein [Gossypium harknessii]
MDHSIGVKGEVHGFLSSTRYTCQLDRSTSTDGWDYDDEGQASTAEE